jgi:transcription elongation factor Elf1
MKLNSYDFDDLLVSCAEEITLNGFSSEAIPRTVKDWLAGKIVESIPQILLNRILALLVEQRDTSGLITCHDKTTKDYSQVSIMIFKNEQMRAWHEAKGEEFDETVVFDKNEAAVELNDFFATEQILFPSGLVRKREIEEDLKLENKQCSTEAKRIRLARKLAGRIDDKTQQTKNGLNSRNGQERQNNSTTVTYPDQSGLNDSVTEDNTFQNIDSDCQSEPEPEETQEGDTICCVCQKPYSNLESLRSHQKRIHPEYWRTRKRPYKKSGKRKSREMFSTHFACNFCDSTRVSSGHLWQHFREKHPGYLESMGGIKSGKKFNFNGEFDAKLDPSQMPYKIMCYICNSKFSTKQECEIHAAQMHPEFYQKLLDKKRKDQLEATCTICNRTLASKSHLTEHMFSHTGGHPNTCEVCGKGFSKPYMLKRHMYTHNGNWPVSCPVCGKGFRDEYKLWETHCKGQHPQEYQVWRQNKLITQTKLGS